MVTPENPSGTQINLGGSLAVVPDLATLAVHSSWGRVKAIYR